MSSRRKRIELDDEDDEEQLDDRLPVFATVTEIKPCDCCGRDHMKRTIRLSGEFDQLHLGVVCAGLWFGLNLSGNIFKAASKLAWHINNNMTNDELKDALAGIREASEEW